MPSSTDRPARADPQAPPPRASRTRKALMEACKRMISNGRMAGASIDDIVREADVAKGSFFNHYTDQNDLSAHVLAEVRTELEASIEQANDGVTDPAARMARGMLASFRYGMVNQVSARVILYDVGDSTDFLRSHPLLMEDLRAGATQKTFRLDDLEAGIVLVLGLSDLGLSRLLDLRLDFEHARAVMRDICVTLLRGLGVDARRIERIVDESLKVVIDAPRQAG